MRHRLTSAFVAIVAAFLALDFVVLVSLWPRLQDLERLSTRYAANSSLVARMRGDVQAIRAVSTQIHVRASAGLESGSIAPDLATAQRDFAAASAEYGAIAGDPEEAALWEELAQRAFPAFREQADRVAASSPPEGNGPDTDALAELAARAAALDRMLQRLAELNAESLDQQGREIHASVEWLLALCVALGIAGIIGGAVLMRWALRAVGEYERGTQERLRELDDFAGRVAHDLRNPLQAIGMSLSLIERQTTEERVLATCARARASAKRMAEFIQVLLTFARSGAVPEQGASASVRRVLDDVRSDLAHQAEEKGINLEVAAADDLHAAIAPEALRAIVANLAENAVKHMPPETAARRVEVAATGGRGEVRIEVRDTGAGIPEELLPRIFDPFFRGAKRAGNFGIGLKTVQRLVNAHGGRVQVESRVGQGSTFTVILPAGTPPVAEAASG